MKEIKKIVVTGGLGFIGFNLVEKFLKEKYEVIIIDSMISGTKNKISGKKNLKVFDIDLSDKKEIKNIINSSDLLIHLAAKGNVVESVQEPIKNFNQNVFTTIQLLEILKESERCKKVIFSSTGGALMGDTSPPVNEKSCPNPISPYGASKLACEGYINAYSNCYGLNSIVFRFGNVYGPNGSHKKGVVNKFIRNSINDIEHIIYGSPNSSRDYIHVYDICEAILLGIEYFSKMQKNFELFHLANFEEVTLSKLIETIEKVSKKKNSYKLLEHRKGEVLRNFCSFEKANNLLKFNPKYNLERGIEDLYFWILENEFV